MVHLQPMDFERLSGWLKGPAPYIIAGPCGAESREQLLETARGLQALQRISLFRAGVWKPRTRPGSFEGMGAPALDWLQEVKRETGLAVTVEVASAQHVEAALKAGIDVLWIGARTTVNPFTVQQIADSLKGVDIPVLIKNPVHAELQLWIGAIERISQNGIKRMAAVHRGFHYYGSGPFRNNPMWHLPIELRTIFPTLPILCDPSHIAGNRTLLPSISQKALDLGMDGLMIESHFDPSAALSDAAQQVTPGDLEKLLSGLVIRHAECTEETDRNRLSELRRIIDEIDSDIMNGLKKRVQIIEQIGAYKKEHNITIFQLERWQEILRSRGQWADRMGLSRQHVEKLCQLLHEESIRLQNELMNDGSSTLP
jgi:chorismate mutase